MVCNFEILFLDDFAKLEKNHHILLGADVMTF